MMKYGAALVQPRQRRCLARAFLSGANAARPACAAALGSSTGTRHSRRYRPSAPRSRGWASASPPSQAPSSPPHAARSVSEPDETTMLNVLARQGLRQRRRPGVTDTAMRVCGGAAFSKHLPIERAFRDARAGSVMAPTADVLYDFYGKAVAGLPLFYRGRRHDQTADRRCRRLHPQRGSDLGGHPRLLPRHRRRDGFRAVLQLRPPGRRTDRRPRRHRLEHQPRLCAHRPANRRPRRPLAQRDTDTTFRTVFVAPLGSSITGPDGFNGTRLALGSADSAHAAILPLHYLAAGRAAAHSRSCRSTATSANTATPGAANWTRWRRCWLGKRTSPRSESAPGTRWAPAI